MGTYIHGTFKDRQEHTIEVQIRSRLSNYECIIGNDNDSDIYFTDEPIQIETVCDDLFTHIIKKSCTINLLSRVYLGDKLFAGNSESVGVLVYKDNEIIFQGFVEPDSFNQPYAKTYEPFTLNCIDFLGTLQYHTLLDLHSYDNLLADSDIYSFKHYIDLMRFEPLGRLYYDGSKTVSGQSALDVCGVSMNVFLGDSEDDVMTFEEILEEILKYLNLHIIQEGDKFLIFDWKTLENENPSLTTFSGNSAYTVADSNIQVTSGSYSSDSTQLSMSEVFNQVQVKCELEDIDELISNPIDADELTSHYDKHQLFMTELMVEGISPKDCMTFADLLLSPMVTDCYSSDGGSDESNWKARDWYVKWLYNPNWKLTYANGDIESLMTNIGGTYVDQYKVMELLRSRRFMPALINIKQQKECTTATNMHRQNAKKDSGQNYLVISVNGNESDTETEANIIDWHNEYASGTDGILQYTSNSSASYSPVSSGVTNYIVFGGKIALAPIYHKTANETRSNDVTLSQQIENAMNGDYVRDYFDYMLLAHEIHKDMPKGGFYAQEFWKASSQTAKPTYQPEALYEYPFINTKEKQAYEYYYTSNGSTADIYDKIPILECELKIGDKYLVENTWGLNSGHTSYSWLTYDECPWAMSEYGEQTAYRKTTFTLGFDPEIGDFLLGVEYPLCDTVDSDISDESGTAIPIKNTDALSGALSFKIKGVVSPIWNQITRIHPTLFRHTRWESQSVNLLSHVSAIWIKDFSVKLVSDNGGKDVKSESKDLIYLSDETHNFIKKKDDVEFKLVTMPTVEEAVNLGIKTTISFNNVINLNTNLPLEGITFSGETERAERHYINQYYNYYYAPKVLLETDIHNDGYSLLNTFTFNGFGKMLTQNIVYDVKQNNVHITCRQL
jgi:hypothetical protein